MVEKHNVSVTVNVAIEEAKKAPRNYDGRPLTSDEVLVPIPQDDLFIKNNVTNPDSIRTYHMGGAYVKVVLTAVPKEFAEIAKSQLTFVENEMNGKYRTKNSVSLDERMENYDLETPDPLANTEATAIENDERAHAGEIYTDEFKKLLTVSPRLAVAYLFKTKGLQGKEFAEALNLGHDAANTLRIQVDAIWEVGLGNFDLSSIKCNKRKSDEYYLALANEILDHLVEWMGDQD